MTAKKKLNRIELLKRQITECEGAEKALRDIIDFNQALLNTIPFGMEIVDRKGNILFMNKNLEKVFGENALGKKCWEIYKENGKQCAACPLKDSFKPGRTRTLEVENIVGGRAFQITHTSMMFKGKKAVLEIFQDITTRKQAERSLKEAMRIKTDFVSMVSHELRTPLAVIDGTTDLVLKDASGALNAKQKEQVSRIKRNADRLIRLVNDVLNFQRLDAGMEKFHIREHDINNAAREVYDSLSPLAKEKKLKLVLDLDEEVPKTKFDRDRIVQVLTNLVNNAIKFTEGGKVAITTGMKGGALHVSVRDTGCGIKEEDIPKLFARFERLSGSFTKDPGGTGLGLAISKNIIEKHGGRIWVESKTGRGSTFHFVLGV